MLPEFTRRDARLFPAPNTALRNYTHPVWRGHFGLDALAGITGRFPSD